MKHKRDQQADPRRARKTRWRTYLAPRDGMSAATQQGATVHGICAVVQSEGRLLKRRARAITGRTVSDDPFRDGARSTMSSARARSRASLHFIATSGLPAGQGAEPSGCRCARIVADRPHSARRRAGRSVRQGRASGQLDHFARLPATRDRALSCAQYRDRKLRPALRRLRSAPRSTSATDGNTVELKEKPAAKLMSKSHPPGRRGPPPPAPSRRQRGSAQLLRGARSGSRSAAA